MINENYTYYRNKHLNLSKFTNISIEEINDFYESSNTTLKSNLETALRRLQKQSLIYWTYALTVCYIDTRIQRTDTGAIKATKHEYINEKGEKVLSFDTVKPIQELSYRKATKEEISIILEIERNLLKEYNCKDKSQLYKMGKINEYYEKVKNQLFDRTNIIFYYNSYEITFNDKHVQDRLKELRLEELEREINQNFLNKGIREKLEEKAITRHEAAFLKDDPFIHKKNFRTDNTYVDNQNTLSDTLINKSYKLIKDK